MEPSPENLEALLGPDLWALATSVGGPPVEALELTTLPSTESERASYRLVFADGSVRKGRRMRDSAWARRLRVLRDLVPCRHLPALLGAQGTAVLTEWCDGEHPGVEDTDACRAAGALLASLHAIAVPPNLIREFGFPFDRWALRLKRNLEVLEEWDALDGDRVAQAIDLASNSAPTDSPRGLVHCDYCPENLVIDANGTIVLIDNENLTLDALAFDLARTCYRWPLEGKLGEAFWAGYETLGDPSPFLGHQDYWMIQALSEAAAFRVASRTSDVDVPLRALTRILSGEHSIDEPE